MILHTVDMGRGGGEYTFLSDSVLRTSFYSDLNTMLQELEYKVVACVIKKPEHVAQYKNNAVDPYHYSLDILIERFCKELGTELDRGFICAEKRNPKLDSDLMEAWETLLTSGAGTGYATSKEIDKKIVGFTLRDKKPNLAGMQLADLVITPIGRHVAGKTPKADQVQWGVVESKFRRHMGRYKGVGLVILP